MHCGRSGGGKPRLVNQYMKTQAAATVDFRGEQLGTYGLLKTHAEYGPHLREKAPEV